MRFERNLAYFFAIITKCSSCVLKSDRLLVPRLIYRTAALRDLAEIGDYIERESSSREVADTFIEKITDYCEKLAALPGLLGRARLELRPQYRSTTFGSYVIFLRYADEGAPRSHLYVMNVIHGARDIDAYFASHPEED